MDRLSTLSIVTLALAGCENKQTGEPAPGRANVAKVTATNTSTEATLDAFCDKRFGPGTGPVFQLPALVDGTLPATASTWRWINVWATWCAPCLEEMPRLARWRETLAAAGKPIELAFISVDEDPADLAAYRKQHPEAPPQRLADATKQADWYTALGLDAAAPIPIHVFVAPDGRIRCARAAGVRETDYGAIEKLLGP